MKLLAPCILALASSFSVMAIADDAAQKVDVIDKIAAVVDDNIILYSELEVELADVKRRLTRDKIQLPGDDVLIQQVLESMILRQLQLSEAKKRGLTVDDISLNEALKQIADQNKLSLSGFRQQLLDDGLDYEEYREDLRRDMLIRNLRQKAVYNRVAISEREADDFIKAQKSQDTNIEYLVSHIQISIPEAADAAKIKAAEARAEAVYQRLLKGEDFAAVAVAESDSQTALQGGDLGWLHIAEIPSLFADAAHQLKVGEISKPIRAARGFHIVKLRQTKGIQRHIVRQVHARHILLATDTLHNDTQVRKELEQIRQQIIDGADFAELAKQKSADPGSAAGGGDLGWSEPDAYAEQFQLVVKTLPDNKISEPFKTRFGWHIVQVLGWRDYDNTEEMERDQAFRALHARKARVEEELWLRRLRDEAYVEIRI